MVPIPELPEDPGDAGGGSSSAGDLSAIDEGHKVGAESQQPEVSDNHHTSTTTLAEKATQDSLSAGGHKSGELSTRVQEPEATTSEGSGERVSISTDSPRKRLFAPLLVGVIVVLVAVLSVRLWYGRHKADMPVESVAEGERPGSAPADLPQASTSQQPAVDDTLWVVKDVGFCIKKDLSVSFSDVFARIFEDIFSLKENRDWTSRTIAALGLKQDVIATMVLSGDQGLVPGVLVLDLQEQQQAGQLNVVGQPLENVDRFSLRRLAASGERLAFVVVGDRRVVIGREDAIRQLFADTQSSPQNEIWRGRLRENVVCLTMIRGASLDNRPPMWWFDPWPAVANAWRTIWSCTDLFTASLKPGEKQTVCLLEWIAKDSRQKDSLEKNVRTLLAAMIQYFEASLSVSTNNRPTGPNADSKEEGDQDLLETWLSIVKTAQVGVTETSVTLTCTFNDNNQLDNLAEKLVSLVKSQWQHRSEIALEGYHGQWGKAIVQYERNHQVFPMAAGGGVLLPPETRLSWVAGLLPYMDREDWAKSLNLGYSWNSAQNRDVTQRYLPAVTNPLLGPTQTVKGYYDSHFVGVTGLGQDSAELPPTHPRAGVFNYRGQVRASDIKDGLSNTMAIVGAEKELGPWAAGGRATARALTKPPYVNGPDGFGSAMTGGMLVTMADGSVRFIRKDIDPRVLEQLATIAGEEPVTVDLLEPKASAERGSLTPSEKVDEANKDGGKPTDGVDILVIQLLLDPCRADSEEATSDHSFLDSSLKRPLAQIRLRTSLALAMSLFTQWSNVPLVMDPESAEWLRISGRENVEIDIKDTTFEGLATSIAKQFGLSLLMCGRSVVLVSPDRLNKRARYEFLLQDNAASVPLSKETLELVCDWFNKVTSAPSESCTTVSCADDRFVVEGPVPVILEIRKLLENPSDTDTLQDRANDGDTTISLNFFEPTRLIDVAVAINRLSEDKVFFDWPMLSRIDVTPDTDVSISASHEPLPDVLVRLAESIRAEVHRLPGGAFLVSAPQRHSTGFVRLYSIGDFLDQGLTPGQLRERIVKECVPESWAGSGGKGILLYDRAASGFVVLTSPNVHQELQVWFEKQRRANRGQ